MDLMKLFGFSFSHSDQQFHRRPGMYGFSSALAAPGWNSFSAQEMWCVYVASVWRGWAGGGAREEHGETLL